MVISCQNCYGRGFFRVTENYQSFNVLCRECGGDGVLRVKDQEEQNA